MSKSTSWTLHGDDQFFLSPDRDHSAHVLKVAKPRSPQSRLVQQLAHEYSLGISQHDDELATNEQILQLHYGMLTNGVDDTSNPIKAQPKR